MFRASLILVIAVLSSLSTASGDGFWDGHGIEFLLAGIPVSAGTLSAGDGEVAEKITQAARSAKESVPAQRWQVRAEVVPDDPWSTATETGGGGMPWDSVRVVEQGEEVQGSCAQGTFYPVMELLGWHVLSVATTPECPDVAQAHAAGYVEGRLTWQLVWQQYQNEFGAKVPSAQLREYVRRNLAYIGDKIREYSGPEAEGKDPEEANFWWQVALVLEQLRGLETGYLSVAPPEKAMTSFDFLLLCLHGDLEDLQAILAMAAEAPGSGSLITSAGVAAGIQSRRLLRGGEGGTTGASEQDVLRTEARGPGGLPLVSPDACSSLIKLLPGNEDLFFSQATWTRLETMLRVFKSYSFHFHTSFNSSDPVPGTVILFSGYPGRLFSGDDFYAINTRLVVQETTIGNSNAELYKKYVKPEGSVLEWVRNMVANRLATSGVEWAAYFSRHNSGTYNNQWMVIDSKRFTPGEAPSPGTLWVLEQLPGNIEAADMTSELVSKSYWASYNTPAFPRIFNLSGFAELEKEYGDFFSHEQNVRAKIFRRDHARVVDGESLQRLMRYNDYLHDPLSACDCDPPYSAELAIAARGDLNKADGTYALPYFRLRDHAETDVKWSSSKQLSSGKMAITAISGPTWDQQPPFRWSTSPFANVTHLGHPDLFLFPWITFEVKA